MKIVTCVACFCVAPGAMAERLIGLGVHQETGRDIYLGALYLNEDTQRPADLRDLAAPRTMEYRVVARRTSIRSLLGGMLLQSEIATGNQPSANTTQFADALLSKIKSSLYEGDSLKIALNPDNTTAASLNGHIVTTVNDPEVANYLLAGWLTGNGASTQFRSAINATTIDSALRARLESTTASNERSAAIAASLGVTSSPTDRAPDNADDQKEVLESDEAQTAVIAAPAPSTPEAPSTAGNNSPADVFQPGNTDGEFATLTPEEVEELPLAQTYPREEPPEQPRGSAASNAPASSSSETAALNSSDKTESAEQETVPALNLEPTLSNTATTLGTSLETQQNEATAFAGLSGVAIPNTSVSLTSEDLGSLELDSEVLSLGVREYSKRLSAFHNDLVAKVYRQIKYPKRAVRRNLEGRIELDITLRKSGELVTVAVAQSSGHKLLDEAAVKAAEAAMASGNLAELDVVAVAEFGNREGRVVVPVPVNFQLTQN